MRSLPVLASILMLASVFAPLPWVEVEQTPTTVPGAPSLPTTGSPTPASEASRTPSSRNYDLPGSNSPVTFTNVSIDVGLENVRADQFAWGDYNNDGYLDLLCRGNTSVGTMLWENTGPPDYTFINVTSEKGIFGRGYCSWADMDNDGDLDFVQMDFNDMIFENLGPPDYNFDNVTPAAMWDADGGLSEGAGWGDYDNDGYIDLYITAWVSQVGLGDWPNCGMPDHLWHNEGGTTFTDRSSAAGVATGNPSYASMGCVWADFDEDGDQDLYVNNYHVNPNYLYENQGDGTFLNKAKEHNVTGNKDFYSGSGPYYGHSAGAGWADWNNDGDLDLFVANLAHKDSEEYGGGGRGYFCDDSMIYESSGAPDYHFTDRRAESGIPITPVGAVQGNMWKDEDYFGVAWADWDNDGDLDLFVPEIKTYHSWAYSHLWRNDGDGTFTDVSDDAGAKVWSTSGAAWADYDNDGDQDLIVEGTYPYQGKRQVHLYRNQGNDNHWLHIDLEGTDSNREAIGARVELQAGGVTQTHIVGGESGGHSFQNSYLLEFGLGSLTKADEIEIKWPSGDTTLLVDIDADQVLKVVEGGVPTVTGEVSDAEVDEDEVVGFTATASYAGGSITTMRWDFDGNGTWDWSGTPAEASSGVLAAYTLNGTYNATVRAEATDGYAAEFGPVVVVVRNVAPTAGLWVSATEILEGGTVTFRPSSSTDTASDNDHLSFQLDFGDGDEFSGPSPVGWYSIYSKSHPPPQGIDADHTYEHPGTYNATLWVMDDDGAMDDVVLEIVVRNIAPSIKVQPMFFGVEDAPVAFICDATDLSQTADAPFFAGFQFKWLFSPGDTSPWSPQNSSNFIFSSSGEHQVELRVRDPDGGVNTTYVTANITNPAPTCRILEPENGDGFEEDEEVSFDGEGDDTPSDLSAGLMYRWDFGDGDGTEWSNDTYAEHTFATSGEHVVELLVMDDDGAIGNRTIVVEVENVDPEAEASLGDRVHSHADEDETVMFTAEGSTDTDSDVGALRYLWSIDGGDPVEGFNINWTFYKSGRHVAELTVEDDDGDTDEADVIVNVDNVVPKAVISWINGEAMEGEWDVTLEMIVELHSNLSTDTPSDLANLTYTWDWGDDTESEGSVGTHVYDELGEYTVELTVEDDDRKKDTAEITLVVGEAEPDGWVPDGGDGGDGNVSVTPVKEGNAGLIAGIVGAVVAVVVVMVVVLLMLMKKKKPAGEMGAMGAQPGAGGPPGQGPPPQGGAGPPAPGGALPPGGGPQGGPPPGGGPSVGGPTAPGGAPGTLGAPEGDAGADDASRLGGAGPDVPALPPGPKMEPPV